MTQDMRFIALFTQAIRKEWGYISEQTFKETAKRLYPENWKEEVGKCQQDS